MADFGFCFSANNFFNFFTGPSDCLVAHAFQWHDGTKTDLGALPGNANSGFTVISANGLIAGVSEDPFTIDPMLGGIPEFHAVLWKNGKITELGALTEEGGHSSTADAVNSRGQVVGGAFTENPDPFSLLGTGFQTRAFLWQNGLKSGEVAYSTRFDYSRTKNSFRNRHGTSYSPSNVTCTSFISAIFVMTIACIPLRSNTIPSTRTYLPTKGISFCL